MENVLEVKALSKQYTKVLAADKVSFEIGKGEIFALIGPNGAGKTTTIRMISTLLTPTAGDAIVAGHSVVKEPEKVRTKHIWIFPWQKKKMKEAAEEEKNKESENQ